MEEPPVPGHLSIYVLFPFFLGFFVLFFSVSAKVSIDFDPLLLSNDKHRGRRRGEGDSVGHKNGRESSGEKGEFR